jgi:predicted esterase
VHSRTISLPDAVVYVPAGAQPGKTYPLAVVFTPDRAISRTLGNWKAVADRFHWIVYASKEYSNVSAGHGFPQLESRILSHVERAIGRFPVDRTRVILAGFSGGGYMAEDLNARDPGLAHALVIDANGYYAYGDDPFLPLPTGAGRPAVFLYSPDDKTGFGWAARADRAVYQAHGWSTLLLYYPGGHVDAPTTQYLRAAAWIQAHA